MYHVVRRRDRWEGGFLGDIDRYNFLKTLPMLIKELPVRRMQVVLINRIDEGRDGADFQPAEGF